MTKKSITLFALLAFIVGIGIAFGIARGIVFFVENSEPEVVVLDPSLKFSAIRKEEVAIGGPEPELDPVPADVALEEDAAQGYILKGGGSFPKTYARSLIVADIETGDVIASKNPHLAYPIASISKLMTAIVAEETYHADDEVSISAKAVSTYGAQGRLKKGEIYTVKTLMYPLLLESSNDAAEALAEYGGRIGFLADMNLKAQALGLTHTKFDDPSGLSAKNISSAFDLFLLSQYIYEFRSYIWDITKEKQHKEAGKTWYSNSRFKNDSYYAGGKNGYTDEALKTQIVLAELPLEGEDGLRTIAIIVLGSSNTEADTRAIVKFLTKYVYYE